MSGTPKCAATLAASLGTELPESICARSPDRRQRTGTTARMRPRRCTNSPPPPPRDRRTRTAHLEFRRVECLLHRAALAGGQRASEAAYSPEGVVANPRGLLPRPRRHASERALHSTIRAVCGRCLLARTETPDAARPRGQWSCSLASGTWLPYKGWHRRRPRRGLRASAGCRPRRCRWCGSTLATTQR